MNRQEAFDAIELERARQADKFPGQWGVYKDRFSWGHDWSPHYEYATMLGEEYGEVCRGVWDKDLDNIKEELIQVAAVAVAWLEALP